MTNEINSATVTQDEVIKWSREAQSTLEKTQKYARMPSPDAEDSTRIDYFDTRQTTSN